MDEEEEAESVVDSVDPSIDSESQLEDASMDGDDANGEPNGIDHKASLGRVGIQRNPERKK